MVEAYLSCILFVCMYILAVFAYCVYVQILVYSISVRVYSIYWEQLPLINCLWFYITIEVSARMPSVIDSHVYYVQIRHDAKDLPQEEHRKLGQASPDL